MARAIWKRPTNYWLILAALQAASVMQLCGAANGDCLACLLETEIIDYKHSISGNPIQLLTALNATELNNICSSYRKLLVCLEIPSCTDSFLQLLALNGVTLDWPTVNELATLLCSARGISTIVSSSDCLSNAYLKTLLVQCYEQTREQPANTCSYEKSVNLLKTECLQNATASAGSCSRETVSFMLSVLDSLFPPLSESYCSTTPPTSTVTTRAEPPDWTITATASKAPPTSSKPITINVANGMTSSNYVLLLLLVTTTMTSSFVRVGI